MKKFVLLVVLLHSELHHKVFCNHIFFCCYCKTVSLQDKIISKLGLLNFLFDLFGYLLNFFHNVWYLQNAHELHIKICFINTLYSIFYNCSGVYQASIFKRCLSICNWKLNGICAHNFTKLHPLRVYVSVHKFDIICLSET